MPRFTARIDILKFDAKSYSQAMKKQVEVSMRQSARAFVRAAYPLIPVSTGMARGSLLLIGQSLRVAVPITPILYNQLYHFPNSKRKIPKTPASGSLLTTKPEDLFHLEGPNKIVFHIESKIFHLTLEDLIGHHSPTAPWGSFEAGRIAFLNEMRNLKNRLPKVKSYITKTNISYGRGSGIRSAPIRLRKQETVNG